jgi:hypothetical protein
MKPLTAAMMPARSGQEMVRVKRRALSMLILLFLQSVARILTDNALHKTSWV